MMQPAIILAAILMAACDRSSDSTGSNLTYLEVTHFSRPMARLSLLPQPCRFTAARRLRLGTDQLCRSPW